MLLKLAVAYYLRNLLGVVLIVMHAVRCRVL